ncbi:MAG: hypothetical protein H0T60_06305 [Acidobacteria bacterium]|nr:hypothetical protein [Acidobacteriota bacterium]
MRRRGKNDDATPRRDEPGRVRWYNDTAGLIAIVLTALLLPAGGVILYQRFKLTGPYRIDYEGRVVDKSLTLRETEEGTQAVTHLIVEGKDAARFRVSVNRGLYDRAQVGMWIRSNRDGAELSWSEPSRRPPTGEEKEKGAEHPSMSAPENPSGPTRR